MRVRVCYAAPTMCAWCSYGGPTIFIGIAYVFLWLAYGVFILLSNGLRNIFLRVLSCVLVCVVPVLLLWISYNRLRLKQYVQLSSQVVDWSSKVLDSVHTMQTWNRTLRPTAWNQHMEDNALSSNRTRCLEDVCMISCMSAVGCRTDLYVHMISLGLRSKLVFFFAIMCFFSYLNKHCLLSSVFTLFCTCAQHVRLVLFECASCWSDGFRCVLCWSVCVWSACLKCLFGNTVWKVFSLKCLFALIFELVQFCIVLSFWILLLLILLFNVCFFVVSHVPYVHHVLHLRVSSFSSRLVVFSMLASRRPIWGHPSVRVPLRPSPTEKPQRSICAVRDRPLLIRDWSSLVHCWALWIHSDLQHNTGHQPIQTQPRTHRPVEIVTCQQ